MDTMQAAVERSRANKYGKGFCTSFSKIAVTTLHWIMTVRIILRIVKNHVKRNAIQFELRVMHSGT
jgi:hypothetical protein